jgi:glucokinase
MLTAAQAGDKAAMVTWEQMMKDLARGVVSLINTLDPELVLLAGGITSAGDALMTSLQSKLEQWEWRPGGVGVTLAIADLAEWAGAFGARLLRWEFHLRKINIRL